jgi:exopolyphosphatase/guanosine-5'-triphosphate,3'-diphosphate pyrophosphatase
MIVAVGDVGTHTTLLLIAEVKEGKVRPIMEHLTFTRLGEGVDSNRKLSTDAMDRVAKAIVHDAEVAHSYNVDTLHVAATSAARDASNRDELIDRLNGPGISAQVISAEKEAYWSLRGVLSGHNTEPVTVIDLGGGSTELISGDHHAISQRESFDMGSVRLTERLVDPAGRSQSAFQAVRDEVRQTLQRLPAPPIVHQDVIGVAGTFTTLAGLELGLTALHPGRVDGFVLERSCISHWANCLAGLPPEEVLAFAPGLLRGRSHILPTGVVMLDTMMEVLEISQIEVSVRGLRYGWALQVADQ